MTGTRRVLLGGLVAAPAIATLAVPAMGSTSSTFAAAWAAYNPYRDTSGCHGLDDAATSAWCNAQLAATASLAEAPAGNLVELEAKLAEGLLWFDNSGATNCICEEEADLLRSCLTDLRAIMGRVAA